MKKEIRDYVVKRALTETNMGLGGKMMSGVDVQKTLPLLDQIPDKELAAKLRGLFSITPKYQLLNIISDPRHDLMKRFPERAEAIVEAATEVDYKADTMIPEAVR